MDGDGPALRAGTPAGCLRGAIGIGFSLVVFEGGSLDDLVSCAEGRHVTALYALSAGEYLPYIVGAPEFATARFRALFADGVPALLPLVVRSAGPPTPGPAASPVTEPFATCLRGEIAEGFSLVVYEGGSIADLEACARDLGVTALYALVEGEYVPYIPGAPEFATARFRALFADGVPAATPADCQGRGAVGAGAAAPPAAPRRHHCPSARRRLVGRCSGARTTTGTLSILSLLNSEAQAHAAGHALRLQGGGHARFVDADPAGREMHHLEEDRERRHRRRLRQRELEAQRLRRRVEDDRWPPSRRNAAPAGTCSIPPAAFTMSPGVAPLFAWSDSMRRFAL